MNQSLYYVEGMHCANCALRITEAIENLKGVKSAKVSFAQQTAKITTTKPISLETLNKAIAPLGSYSLVTKVQRKNALLAGMQTYKPIIAIYVLLIGFVYLRAPHSMLSTHAMADFMGGFFVIFSLFKLANLKNFPEAFKKYDLLAQRIPGYATAYPFIELALGIGYLARFQMTLLSLVTIVVMGIGAIGVTRALKSKNHFECACLGGFFKLPMSKVALFEDVSMVVMATIMLFQM